MTTECFLSPATLRAEIHAVDAISSRTLDRHTHDQYGIGFLVSGAQRSASGRGEVYAEAGDAITVNPEEVHDGCPFSHSSRHWRMLYFDTAYFAKLLGFSVTEPIEFSNPVFKDVRVTAAVQRLFEVATSTSSLNNSFELDEALLVTVHSMTEKRQKRPDNFINYHGILRAKERMDDCPTSAVSLLELEKITDLSRFQIIRGFAKLTGLTPHAYLLQNRLDVARQLIRSGSSIANATYDSGFADQSHFNRHFKRRYGLTPFVYARNFDANKR
jgi:AraC-like DNA-binding protein